MGSPDGSTEPALEKWTVSGTLPESGVTLACAMGGGVSRVKSMR